MIDISDPTTPTQVASYETSQRRTEGVAVYGNYVYVADYDDGLVVIDVTDPVAPALVGEYDTSGNAKEVAVAGNYAYVADFYSELAILRLSSAELQITRSGEQVIVSWPASATGFSLRGSSRAASGTIWSPLTDGLATVGDRFTLTNSASAGTAFYRLRQQ